MRNTGIEYTSSDRVPDVLLEMEQLLPPLCVEQFSALESSILAYGYYTSTIANRTKRNQEKRIDISVNSSKALKTVDTRKKMTKTVGTREQIMGKIIGWLSKEKTGWI